MSVRPPGPRLRLCLRLRVRPHYLRGLLRCLRGRCLRLRLRLRLPLCSLCNLLLLLAAPRRRRSALQQRHPSRRVRRCRIAEVQPPLRRTAPLPQQLSLLLAL